MSISQRLVPALLLLCAGLILLPASIRAQAFEECVQNINNATVVIPVSAQATVSGEAIETGDEVAVFTDDGTCAGRGVWSDGNLSIAAAGVDSQTPVGFEPGESLHFRVWDASTGIVYDADVTYTPCDTGNPLCKDDGRYEPNRLYHIGSLEAVTVSQAALAAFDVTVQGSETTLHWQTTAMTNSTGFEVQHRPPSVAADDWTRVAFVDGKGTTGQAQQYTHRLDNLPPGTNHFRLKQVNPDGTVAFSAPVEAVVAMSTPYRLVAPYPNPFRQQASFDLRVADAQHVHITAYNQLGQRVATLHNGPLAPNEKHAFTLTGDRLSSGLYFIRIHGETFSTTARAVLVR